MTVGIGLLVAEDHLTPLEHGSLGYQHNGVAAGIGKAVRNHQFGEVIDVEFVFGDDTAIGSAGHGG